MRQLLLAIHRPKPEHVDDLVGPMSRFGSVLARRCAVRGVGGPTAGAADTRRDRVRWVASDLASGQGGLTARDVAIYRECTR